MGCIYSGKKKPCLGYCVSTGVRMLKAVGYQVDNTEDGVALRGEVCNIPNRYVLHTRNRLSINYLDYLGTATKRENKKGNDTTRGERKEGL